MDEKKVCENCYWWDGAPHDITGWCDSEETMTRYTSYCKYWKAKEGEAKK